MCGERDESITSLITECKKIAQKEYKKRHDNIARIVILELFQKFCLVGEVKWYNRKPASVFGNDRAKILWDFKIQTDHVIQHKRPDIVVLYKTERKCHLIDIAVPGDKSIVRKGRQLQKEDLEIVTSCDCFSCNQSPRSDIDKIERLAQEVRCKE